MSRTNMDEYDNAKKSERIQAHEVRRGDVIAAAAGLTHLFIDPDRFRTVRFVEEAEPDPQDYHREVPRVRIGWTSARGADHVETYPADAMFHRIAERPELPQAPGPQPEGLTDRDYDRLRQDQDTYARICVDYLLTPGKSADARKMARKSKDAEKAYSAELERRHKAGIHELIERETNGTTSDREKPIRAGWDSFGVNRPTPEEAEESAKRAAAPYEAHIIP
jgi:hypothetical protein